LKRQTQAVEPSQGVKVPDCVQRSPGQHGWAGEHCWPAAGQVPPLPVPQAPFVWPGGISQVSPEQQSALAVQAPPEGWQAAGAWQVPAMQSAEQQSVATTQTLPFCLQVGVPPPPPPPPHPPPPPPPPEGARHTVGPSTEASQVPSQQGVGPEALQAAPSGVHVGAVQRSVPDASGTHGLPLQHWSLNWQASPAAMQHGATPVKPVGHGPPGSQLPDGQPPKQRGMPVASSLQTALWPSQQSCGALMLPPPGSTGAPQVSPTFWQAVPWVQRLSVGLQTTDASTPPARDESARQHSAVSLQESPCRRHPVAGWQTRAPEPMSTQRFEQQLDPPEHGVPPWPHPPLASRHRPGWPAVAEHRLEQQSGPWRQRSPGAWQA
jgi:hypothetical protein